MPTSNIIYENKQHITFLKYSLKVEPIPQSVQYRNDPYITFELAWYILILVCSTNKTRLRSRTRPVFATPSRVHTGKTLGKTLKGYVSNTIRLLCTTQWPIGWPIVRLSIIFIYTNFFRHSSRKSKKESENHYY